MKSEITKSVEGKLYFVVFFLYSSMIAAAIYHVALAAVIEDDLSTDHTRALQLKIMHVRAEEAEK